MKTQELVLFDRFHRPGGAAHLVGGITIRTGQHFDVTPSRLGERVDALAIMEVVQAVGEAGAEIYEL